MVFELIGGLISLVLLLIPVFLIPLSLLWDFEFSLTISFAFVSGHFLLFFLKQFQKKEVHSLFDFFFFLFFIPLCFLFFSPQFPFLFQFYGMVVNLSRGIVLGIEAFQASRLFCLVGQIGANHSDSFGDEDSSNRWNYFLVFVSSFCNSFSFYLFYLAVVQTSSLDFFSTSLLSGTASSFVTIFFVILIYRRLSSSSSLRGNLLDVSFLGLYLSFIVWISVSDHSLFFSVEEESRQQQQQQHLQHLQPSDAKSFFLFSPSLFDWISETLSFPISFKNRLTIFFLSFGLEHVFSLFCSLASVLSLSVTFYSDQFDEIEFGGWDFSNLLQAISLFLYTNILYTITDNVAFSSESGRIIQVIVAIASYGFVVCFPLLQNEF